MNNNNNPMNNNNNLIHPINNNNNPMNNNNNMINNDGMNNNRINDTISSSFHPYVNNLNNDGMNNNMITNTISSSFHPYVNMGNNMMSRTNTCSHNPYQREQPLLDYIGFLERTIISIFQKLNQSSSSIDFPSIFNDIIPELERRINNSQYFPFHGNDGIYEMMENMLRPDEVVFGENKRNCI